MLEIALLNILPEFPVFNYFFSLTLYFGLVMLPFALIVRIMNRS